MDDIDSASDAAVARKKPKLSIVVLYFAGAIGCLLLFIFTSNKLKRMEMIRGEIPGADSYTGTVVSKRVGTGKYFSKTYLVNVVFEGSEIKRSDRFRLPKEEWDSLAVGSEIRVIHIEGERDFYTPKGIYASYGNTVFDRVLQVLEITGFIACLCIGCLLPARLIGVFA